MNAPAMPSETRSFRGGYAVARDGRVYTTSRGEWRELMPARTNGSTVLYLLSIDGHRVRLSRFAIMCEAWPEDAPKRVEKKAAAQTAAAARMRDVRAKRREEGIDEDDGLEGLAQRWADVACWTFGAAWVARLIGVDPGQVHSWRRGVVPGPEWHGALERLYTLARAETYGISDAAARLRAGDAEVRKLVVWGEML